MLAPLVPVAIQPNRYTVTETQDDLSAGNSDDQD